MDDVMAALAGNMSVASIFGGKDGIKLLMLFITGMAGLTFPWPGKNTIQFAGGIIGTLAKKLKLSPKLAMLKV